MVIKGAYSKIEQDFALRMNSVCSSAAAVGRDSGVFERHEETNVRNSADHAPGLRSAGGG